MRSVVGKSLPLADKGLPAQARANLILCLMLRILQENGR